jgi:hypothetical protein
VVPIEKLRLIGIGLVPILVTIVVNPWSSLDPIASPKLVLALFGIGTLLVINSFGSVPWFIRTKEFLPILFFFLAISLSLIINRTAFDERLFGIYGRNQGYITFLLLLFVSILYLQSKENPKTLFLFSMWIANALVVSYAFLQSIGWDFYDWTSQNIAVISTLGNPNILGSFCAVTALSWIHWIKNCRNKISTLGRALFGIFGIAINFYVIFLTNSGAGMLALVCSLSFYIIVKIYSKAIRYERGAKIIIFFFFALLLSVLFIGALQQNFVSAQSSIIPRLKFWKVGISIFSNYPIFGTGFDTYGDLFTEYAGSENELINIHSSSAHNMWIDTLVFGGVILLSSLVWLQILALRGLFSSFSVKKYEAVKNDNLVMAIFVAFIVQSFFSVPSIAVQIWGWAAMGILLRSHNSEKYQGRELEISYVTKNTNVLYKIMLASIGFALIVSGGLKLSQENAFRSATLALDGERIIQAVERFPKNSFHIFLASEGFRNANIESTANWLEDMGLRFNPRNLLILRQIANRDSDPLRREISLRKLRLFDPKFRSSD